MKNQSQFPDFIYGTAWKEEATASLTQKAIHSGFRAIDTANQKKHYREDFVGEALLELARQGIQRESLFLQTKFTYVQGQDHRLPYDPADTFNKQVLSSFASSLKNLNTHYVDSYLLHGPSTWDQLEDADWEVWETLEDLYRSGQTKAIGVSNFSINQLNELFLKAKIKPMTVQNRCFANQGWDKGVREFCRENNIVYQGFSLLTANPQVVTSSVVKTIAGRMNVTPQQVVFRFAKHIGILPLTGTTQEMHMKEDLSSLQLELNAEDVRAIGSLYS